MIAWIHSKPSCHWREYLRGLCWEDLQDQERSCERAAFSYEMSSDGVTNPCEERLRAARDLIRVEMRTRPEWRPPANDTVYHRICELENQVASLRQIVRWVAECDPDEDDPIHGGRRIDYLRRLARAELEERR